MTALLTARDVHFAYPGAVPALDGLSLTIQAGQKLAILGPNGAGKTTLLLHLNGTLRPQGGALLLDGAPVAYDRAGLRHWRQQVGLVLQDPDDQLFAATVAEDVSFGPLNLGLGRDETRQRVKDALAALGLEDLADRPTHRLSFGQKKRVALAGAIALQPRLLLLDEPTAGLDHHAAQGLLVLLDRLAAAGTTLVLTTHETDLAYQWADRVVLFAGGQVVGEDDAAILLADPTRLAKAALVPPLLAEVACRAWGTPEAVVSRVPSAVLARLDQRLVQGQGGQR